MKSVQYQELPSKGNGDEYSEILLPPAEYFLGKAQQGCLEGIPACHGWETRPAALPILSNAKRLSRSRKKFLTLLIVLLHSQSFYPQYENSLRIQCQLSAHTLLTGTGHLSTIKLEATTQYIFILYSICHCYCLLQKKQKKSTNVTQNR